MSTFLHGANVHIHSIRKYYLRCGRKVRSLVVVTGISSATVT